jgi:hypothetical protein
MNDGLLLPHKPNKYASSPARKRPVGDSFDEKMINRVLCILFNLLEKFSKLKKCFSKISSALLIFRISHLFTGKFSSTKTSNYSSPY